MLMITLLKYIFLDSSSWQKNIYLAVVSKAEIKLKTNMDNSWENYNNVQNLSFL